MTTMPVRLDRLEFGLVAWVRSVLPLATVVWGPSQFPRGASSRQLVSLRMLAGPSDKPLGGAAVSTVELPTMATLTIDPLVASGDTVGIDISGRVFDHVLTVGQDASDARDALLAMLTAADAAISVACEPDGSDAIVMAALEHGDLYKVAARGLCTVEIDEAEFCEVQTSTADTLVELGTFGTRYPSDGAAAMMARLVATTGLTEALAIFDAWGLAVDFAGSPASIDALSGPEWESRSAVTLRVSQLQLAAAPVEGIDRVRGTLDGRTDVASFSLTVDTDPAP